jgi:hypothetical protein
MGHSWAIQTGSGVTEIMMHCVISKVYMEKFKPLIEESNVYISANGRITIVSWKYQLVENNNII